MLKRVKQKKKFRASAALRLPRMAQLRALAERSQRRSEAKRASKARRFASLLRNASNAGRLCSGRRIEPKKKKRREANRCRAMLVDIIYIK